MSRRPRPWRRPAASGWGAGALSLLACEGPQSALAPAGRDAERIADLLLWMAAGAALVWLLVVGLAVYAIAVRPGAHPERAGNALILGGGVALPVVLLAVLLVFALTQLPQVLAVPARDGLRIAVVGEQWWWRVRYLAPGVEPVELANEVRLPVGRRTALRLEGADVIHSFWVPPLAGKMDLIPGRVNWLALEPTRTGVFRGACAEYCGTAHALMRIDAVVMEPDAFAHWLERQRAPAAAPGDRLARRGARAFVALGCGACHTVRGTGADGVVGPDLTHVGSRVRLAAGVLPNDPAGFARWIAQPHEVKPGAHMPGFGMLPRDELRALAAYLDGLR